MRPPKWPIFARRPGRLFKDIGIFEHFDHGFAIVVTDWLAEWIEA
jgi:hypothetical protein